MSIAEIRNGVLRLSTKDRAALAYWIISNLDDPLEECDSNDAYLRLEVRSRVNDIKAGKVAMIAAETMWKDILDEYGKKGGLLPIWPIGVSK